MNLLILFIKKYLKEDHQIDISSNKIKSIINQMINEGLLTDSLIDDALNHEEGENVSLHKIVEKITIFMDSDNYRLFPTTIKISRGVKDSLDELKVHPRESYNEVISKLLHSKILVLEIEGRGDLSPTMVAHQIGNDIGLPFQVVSMGCDDEAVQLEMGIHRGLLVEGEINSPFNQ